VERSRRLSPSGLLGRCTHHARCAGLSPALDVAVLPEWQGQHIGQKMEEALEMVPGRLTWGLGVSVHVQARALQHASVSSQRRPDARLRSSGEVGPGQPGRRGQDQINLPGSIDAEPDLFRYNADWYSGPACLQTLSGDSIGRDVSCLLSRACNITRSLDPLELPATRESGCKLVQHEVLVEVWVDRYDFTECPVDPLVAKRRSSWDKKVLGRCQEQPSLPCSP